MLADVQAFFGSDGTRRVAIADRVAPHLTSPAPPPAGGPAPSVLHDLLRVVPGVEVRSSGDLSLVGDERLNNGWNLQPLALSTSADASGNRSVIAGERAGGMPITLSLRAAGNLNLSYSLSDGFAVPGAGVSALATEAARAAALASAAVVAARAPILSAQGASFRLVAGADMAAADVTATVASTTTGDVVIGRSASTPAQPDVLVRTTTGSIDIAAGRDVKLLNRQAVVYSTGAPVDLSARGDLQYSFTGPSLNRGLGTHPLVDGGGSVNVAARRDILGGSNGSSQYGVDWWWRQGSVSDPGQDLTWYVRYDQFRQGFGALGGGNVTVTAGRNMLDVAAAAPTNGAALSAIGDAPRQQLSFGGGDVTLRAGGDITNGFVFGGGDRVDVRAGGAINASGNFQGLQVLHGDTAVNLIARGDMTLGRVVSAGMLLPLARQDTSPTPSMLVSGLSAHATLQALSESGDLSLAAARPTPLAGSYNGTARDEENVVPAHTRLAAPLGSLRSRALLQAPAQDAQLELLARDDLDAGLLQVTGSLPALAQPGPIGSPALRDLLRPFSGPQPAFENDAMREPVRAVSAEGSVTLDASQLASPLRVLAGQDIVSRGAVTLQHQRADELSLLSAGRDIKLTASTTAFSLKVQGPGEFVATAGRHIDLGVSGGIGSVGDLENRLLSDGGTGITVMAGVKLGSADIAQAVRGGYLLRNPALLDARNEALAIYLAQWNAAAHGQPVPSRDGGNLQRAARLLELARALTAGDPDLSGQLPPNVSDVQIAGLGAGVGAADAGSTTPTTLASLSALVMQAVSKRLAESLPTLAPERQALLTAAVLMADLRAAGRAAAAAATAAEKDAAYQAGYNALATVFPGTRSTGNVSLTSSQIKTQQGSPIRVLTPGGSINAGETFASGKQGATASDLGLVTTNGGAIELAVRDSVLVNQSRVFTVGEGDLLIWASEGNVDAGRGAKTVTGAPPPLVKVDNNGNVIVDTSGSFSGSGIAVLDSRSALDLYAPKGEINAGEAGIISRGNAFFGARVFVGGNDTAVSGSTTGSTGTEVTVNAAAAVGDAGQGATSAGTKVAAAKDEEDERKKRKPRRNLFLDFLGFGSDGAN